MKEDKFIKDNSQTWRDLESTLNKLRSKGLKKFSSIELDSFITNYNKACSHLSYCRTYYGNTNTTSYLNRLVASAHSYIYTTKSSTLKKVLNFFLYGFPLLLKKNIKFFYISTALLFLGIILSFIYTAISPENAAAFVPSSVLNQMDLKSSSHRQADNAPLASYLFTHNILVGFIGFVYGITFCIGTVWVLIQNGFMLGTLACIAYQKNVNLLFWALILPHGIIELFSIIVCGAAGLIIGYSIINPGTYSRKDSLILRGITAIKLVCGTIPIFVIAGIIEGFITPSGLPDIAKLIFAFFTLVALVIYIICPWGRKYQNEV